LQRLQNRGRNPAPYLHPCQMPPGNPPVPQGASQDPGGGDRVGHRQVDTHAADGRHRVRGITDAQQPVAIPAT